MTNAWDTPDGVKAEKVLWTHGLVESIVRIVAPHPEKIRRALLRDAARQDAG